MDKHFKTVVFLTIAGGIGFAFYRAGQGDPTAYLLIGAMGAILFLVIAALLIIGTQYALAAIEQRRFVSNAKENLAIMAAMADTQTRQNRLAAQQVKRLPDPAQSLLIDEGIFSELDEVN